MQTLFDAFAEDTGYNGEMEYVTIQQTEAFQKLQTTISAGLDLPDAISSEIGQRGTMMSLGIWEDLSAEPYNFDESLFLTISGLSARMKTALLYVSLWILALPAWPTRKMWLKNT